MRWAYEGVVFEPSGVDHSSPGLLLRRRRPDRARDLRRRAADRPDVRLRRHQRHGEDVLLQGRRAHPGRRAEDHGGAAAALAVRAPQAQPVLQDRLRPGDPAALRRVGRAGAARSPTARRSPPTPPRTPAPSRTAAGELPTHARARCRTARWPPSSTSPPAHEEQTLRILQRAGPGEPGHLAGRGPAAARPRRALDHHPGPGRGQRTLVRDEPDEELLGLPGRRRRASRCGCCWTGSTAHWSLDGLTTLVYGVPKVQAGLDAGRQADAGAEGRPARLLRAALPAAGRPGHRAAAAHAAAGGGRGPGAQAARRVTAYGRSRPPGGRARPLPRCPGRPRWARLRRGGHVRRSVGRRSCRCCSAA